MKLRTLLLVTYHFPPSAASGGFRLLGFSRHLLACGWRTVVVAPPRMPFEPVDEKLAAKVPAQTRVYSVPFPSGNFLTRRLAPDARWLPAAWKACSRAIAADKPEALLTSSPPHAVHVLGRLLQARHGLPWIADYRDPWMYGLDRPRPRSLTAGWEALKAKMMLKAADAIIVNSPGARKALARDVPRFAAKMHVITNGFDPENFALDEAPLEKASSFAILHTGELYAGRDPRSFFDALIDLQLPPGTKPLQVTFLGKSSDSRFDWPQEIRARGLANVVRFPGQVDYAQAQRQMQNADILLLLDSPGRRVGIPAKLYEYFGARRPILALAEDQSDTAWALRKSGVRHRLAHPTNPAKIRQALTELMGEMANTGNAAPQPVPEEFTRAYLTAQLARVLDQQFSRHWASVG